LRQTIAVWWTHKKPGTGRLGASENWTKKPPVETSREVAIIRVRRASTNLSSDRLTGEYDCGRW
jgi:hypothetical protein